MWVQYDKNVYQGLSDALLNDALNRERARGFRAVANSYVLDELFYRLSDPSDLRAFGRNQRSLRRLVVHCTENAVMMIGPTREEMLAQVLFGIVPNQGRVDVYAHAARLCADEPFDAWPEDVRNWLGISFRERMSRDETSFHEYFTNLIGGDPERLAQLRMIGTTKEGLEAIHARARLVSGTRSVALGTVETYAALNGLTLTPEQLELLAEKAQRVFPLAFEFDFQLKLKILAEGYDLRAGENFNDMWDWLILYSIVSDETIDDVPVRFVTHASAPDRRSRKSPQ